MLYARVIIDVKHSSINSFFDYIIPDDFKDKIEVGMRVYVPFGNQNRLAYIINIINESKLATKEIIEILDDKSVISDDLIVIAKAMLKYPGTHEAGVFETIISSTLFYKYEKIIELVNLDLIDRDEIKIKFKQKNKWKISKTDYQKYYNILKRLENKKAVLINTKIKPRSKAKKQIVVRIGTNKEYSLSSRQLDVVDLVIARGTILLAELTDYVSASVVNTLVSHEVLVKDNIEISRINSIYRNENSKELKLNKELIKVANEINSSNKNEVMITSDSYNDRILLIVDQLKNNISQNKTTLLLVPEIVLIIPLINEIIKYFNEIKILSYHSELSKGVLYDTYESLKNHNSVDLVIGTRNAVFLPIHKLATTIIYDSHNENYIESYKTYFDTLEIAKIKTNYLKSKLIYLSYIQPLRLVNQIKNKNILNIELPINYKLANIEIVDMRDEIKNNNYSIFSNLLKSSIELALENKKQVMLLMNLKGYASFVMCRNCGHIVRDPDNDLPMIYYKKENKLKSRHTKFEKPYSTSCEVCQTNMIRPVSAGVEQLYSQTKKVFPKAKVLFLNQEEIKNADDYLNQIDAFSQGTYDIIIGTTFINKSYNAKNISVIGILMIDQILNLPYFDAYEKSYQYLKQTLQHDFNQKVNVVVQTYNPKNKILNWFKSSEDEKYYKDQLQTRELAKLPPVNQMIQIIFKGDSYFKTYQTAFEFKKQISSEVVEVLGPLPSYLLKEKDLYRFIITVKYQNWSDSLNELLKEFQEKIIIEISSTNNLL